MVPELYGLVLIGGQSRRMGKDKSLISYHSKNQRNHSFELLSNYCEKVFLSCNKDQAVAISLPSIEDSNNYKGPLVGLLSAQEKFPDVAWLVLACDMPFVDEEVLNVLIANRNSQAIATCFFHDFPEPLCSVWEPSSHAPLIKFANSGNLSPKQFLENNDASYIKTSLAIKHKLRNINSPEDRVN